MKQGYMKTVDKYVLASVVTDNIYLQPGS